MALHETPVLFNFEVASSEDFTFIPMAVRFNLDRAGLRISLAQWQLLPYADRTLLARFPVDDDAGLDRHFDEALSGMLRTHGDREPERLPSDFASDSAPAWRRTDALPPGVVQQAQLAGLATPEVGQWAALSPFQRYVLAKLSRKPQANHDFVPAMREFGLAD